MHSMMRFKEILFFCVVNLFLMVIAVANLTLPQPAREPNPSPGRHPCHAYESSCMHMSCTWCGVNDDISGNEIVRTCVLGVCVLELVSVPIYCTSIEYR